MRKEAKMRRRTKKEENNSYLEYFYFYLFQWPTEHFLFVFVVLLQAFEQQAHFILLNPVR